MIKVKVTTNKELSPRAIENLNKVFTEIFNKDLTRFLEEKKKGAQINGNKGIKRRDKMEMYVQLKYVYIAFMLINLCLNIYAQKTKNRTLEIVTWAIVLHVPFMYFILSH